MQRLQEAEPREIEAVAGATVHPAQEAGREARSLADEDVHHLSVIESGQVRTLPARSGPNVVSQPGVFLPHLYERTG